MSRLIVPSFTPRPVLYAREWPVNSAGTSLSVVVGVAFGGSGTTGAGSVFFALAGFSAAGTISRPFALIASASAARFSDPLIPRPTRLVLTAGDSRPCSMIEYSQSRSWGSSSSPTESILPLGSGLTPVAVSVARFARTFDSWSLTMKTPVSAVSEILEIERSERVRIAFMVVLRSRCRAACPSTWEISYYNNSKVSTVFFEVASGPFKPEVGLLKRAFLDRFTPVRGAPVHIAQCSAELHQDMERNRCVDLAARRHVLPCLVGIRDAFQARFINLDEVRHRALR